MDQLNGYLWKPQPQTKIANIALWNLNGLHTLLFSHLSEAYHKTIGNLILLIIYEIQVIFLGPCTQVYLPQKLSDTTFSLNLVYPWTKCAAQNKTYSEVGMVEHNWQTHVQSGIWSAHGSAYENCSLLGCDATQQFGTNSLSFGRKY